MPASVNGVKKAQACRRAHFEAHRRARLLRMTPPPPASPHTAEPPEGGGRCLPTHAATRSSQGRREVAPPLARPAVAGVAHEVEEEYHRREAGSDLHCQRPPDP
jgi:hypothetical protein